MKVQVIEEATGAIVVRVPSQVKIKRLMAVGMTEDEALAVWREQSTSPDRGPVRTEIDHTELPEGHEHFKPARRWSGLAVVVDMPTARAIHMGRIRQARDEKLAALDTETIKALGANDDVRVAEVEAEKQTLRDIPQTFDLTGARTAVELAALWPRGL